VDGRDAVHGRSTLEATANLSADDAEADEQLRSAAEHPALLRLPAAAAGGPRGHGAGLRAVDGVGPKAAANVPADVLTVDGAGANPTAGFPADSPEAAERVHGPVQATLCVTFCELICSPPGD